MKHFRNFSEDWFTKYADEWLSRMRHLVGKPCQVLEIGSFEGQSACWILENILTHPGATITCVDVWDGNDPCLGEKTKIAYHRFKLNTRPYKHKVRIIKDSSITALPKLIELNRLYDIVFVDGNHEGEYVYQDLINGWQLLKDQGWLILDDYNWTWDTFEMLPKEAFKKFLETNPVIQWEEPKGRQLYAKKGLA